MRQVSPHPSCAREGGYPTPLKSFLCNGLRSREKKSREVPLSGRLATSEDLYHARVAHPRLMHSDALFETVAALSCHEVKVPTVKRTRHLAAGDHTVS